MLMLMTAEYGLNRIHTPFVGELLAERIACALSDDAVKQALVTEALPPAEIWRVIGDALDE